MRSGNSRVISDMHSFVAKVIADGRITIPTSIRELLELSKGDFVNVRISVCKHEPVTENVELEVTA